MTQQKLPSFAKKRLLLDPHAQKTRKILDSLNLSTICQEARCPNKCECFSKKRATFLVLGPHCTRNCRFCNVIHNSPFPVDKEEPFRIFEAVKQLNLKHVVITSVTRDDLPDEGSGHFRKIVELLGTIKPKPVIEILVPDFSGKPQLIENSCHPSLDIFNHNLETVSSLYNTIRPQADYKRSLAVLSHVAKNCRVVVKTGIMTGLGETLKELSELFSDVEKTGSKILTIGQYLQPSSNNPKVIKYYTEEEFKELKVLAENKGIPLCYSGVFVRSSYQAEEVYNFLK